MIHRLGRPARLAIGVGFRAVQAFVYLATNGLSLKHVSLQAVDLASSLARRQSGSAGRGEASSRLAGAIGWILHQRGPPGGNRLLNPGRCSDVVLGRNVVFLQSRKQL